MGHKSYKRAVYQQGVLYLPFLFYRIIIYSFLLIPRMIPEAGVGKELLCMLLFGNGSGRFYP